jgi:urease beta subunit
MPKVLDGTNTLSRFPHTRKGLVPGQIGKGETESHLNEARATKGVVPENASLVAVFRRIPVELISHVRFDESRRLLVFRLVSCKGRRLTRVYDVAAVRDASTGELHLVSHRTHNRAVVLS